jgi:hypothetical protein
MKIYNGNLIIIQKITLFSILFTILTWILSGFQLNAINDNGWYLNFIYFFYDTLSLRVTIDGGYNYLGTHFSPVWLIFSPLLHLSKDPILILYSMFYFGYLLIFIALIFVIESKLERMTNYKEKIIIFIFLFGSVTMLFNYSLNSNGIHEVLFAVPFVLVSTYYLFNSENYARVLAWYYPTLLIKEEFWLLIIFIYLAIFFKTSKYRYIFLSLLHGVLFYILYFYIMRYLYINSLDIPTDSIGLMSGHYDYLFNVQSFEDLVNKILNLPLMFRRIMLISLFFIPFIPLVRWKSVKFKDFMMLLILILPTIGYAFLSTHFGMTNFLFDHYSLPIIGVIAVFVIKYVHLGKFRFGLFFLANAILVTAILFNKQPWQYKKYQDEGQLVKEVMPLINRPDNEFSLMDNHTGLYFSFSNMDTIKQASYYSHKIPKYIVANIRYMTHERYMNNHTIGRSFSSLDIVDNISYLKSDSYGIIYMNYPFIVYELHKDGELKYTDKISNLWDSTTKKSNTWL